jgi:outer membrane protein TolC
MHVTVVHRLAAVCVAGQVGVAAPAFAGQATGPDAPAFYAGQARLREYVERALAAHPAIDEARARHRAAVERVDQAVALPDPTVNVTQSIRSPETRVGPQLTSVLVSQTFPWFGTRELRGAVARDAAAAVGATVAIRQRDVIAAVKEVFYDLAHADAALRITGEERLLLEQYERLAASRFAAGQSTAQEVVKLQAEITRVLVRQQELADTRNRLAGRLNILMGDPTDRPIPEVPDLTLPRVDLDRAQLVELGEQHRPELDEVRASATRGESAIALARQNIRPSFTIGAGYTNILERRDPAGLADPPPDNGKNPITVSFGLTLPLRRAKYDAAVRQAAEELAAERERYGWAVTDMQLTIEDHSARLRTIRDQLELFDRALVPQAQEALRSSESAYTTGQASVLDLLDSERVLLDVRLVIARHRSDFLIALSRLERALGAPVPTE